MDIQKKRLCIYPLLTDFYNTFSICKCAYPGKFERYSLRCKDIEDKEIKKFPYNLNYRGISFALENLLEERKKFNEIYNLHIPHFLLSNNLHINEIDLLNQNITNHNNSVINNSNSVLNVQ